jgi:hypothetical protein
LGGGLRLGGRSASETYLDTEGLAIAPNVEGDLIAGQIASDSCREVADRAHSLPVDRGDHVSNLEPGGDRCSTRG